MNIKRQSGMSAWGVMAILIIVIANGIAALKIVPAYFDNMTIKKVLEGMAEPLKKKRMPKGKIKDAILRKLLINSIRDLTPDKIKIVQNSKKTRIDIDYEVRRTLFYNLDAVMTFKNPLEVERVSQ